MSEQKGNEIAGSESAKKVFEPRADKPEMYVLFRGDEMLNVYTKAGAAVRDMMDVDRIYQDEPIVIKDAYGQTYAERQLQAKEKSQQTFAMGGTEKLTEVATLSMAMEWDLRSEGYIGDSHAALLADVAHDAVRLARGLGTIGEFTERFPDVPPSTGAFLLELNN